MKWLVILWLGLGACASGPASGEGCSLHMSGLEAMERRARWRPWLPKAQLRIERVRRPGFDAAWSRPVYGLERARRSPASRLDLTASAIFQWELDAELPAARLAAVRARRARAIGRGACGGRHVR